MAKPSTTTPASGSTRAWRAAWVAAAVALALSIAQAEFLLTNDGPVHLFRASVWNHWDDPALDYPTYFERNVPASSRGVVELLRLLEPLAGPHVAWQLVCVVVAFAWAGGFVAFTRRFGAGPGAGLVGVATALQLPFYCGFLPFVLAAGLGLAAVAALDALDDRLSRPVHTALAALVFLAVAHVHVVPTALAGGAWTLSRVARARSARPLLACSLAGVPAAVIALATRELTAVSIDLVWEPLGERILAVGAAVAPGPPWRALGLGLLLLRAAHHGARDGSPPVRAFVVVGAALWALALCLPPAFLGWEYARERFLPFAAAFVLVGLPASRVASVAATAFTAATLLWSLSLHRQMAAENGSILRELATLRPHPALRLAIVQERPAPIGDTWPWLHIGHVAALSVGGAPAFAQAELPSIHHLLAKRAPRPFRSALRAEPLVRDPRSIDRFVDWGSHFDGIVVIADRDLQDAFLQRGFVAVERTPHVLVADFVGCPTPVVIDGDEGSSFVAVGVLENDDPLVLFRTSQQRTTQDLKRVPCGGLWLLVEREDGRVCREALDDGYVYGVAGSPLRCTLGTPSTAAPPP